MNAIQDRYVSSNLESSKIGKDGFSAQVQGCLQEVKTRIALNLREVTHQSPPHVYPVCRRSLRKGKYNPTVENRQLLQPGGRRLAVPSQHNLLFWTFPKQCLRYRTLSWRQEEWADHSSPPDSKMVDEWDLYLWLPALEAKLIELNKNSTIIFRVFHFQKTPFVLLKMEGNP